MNRQKKTNSVPGLDEATRKRLASKARKQTGRRGLRLTEYTPPNPQRSVRSSVHVVAPRGKHVGYFKDIGEEEAFYPIR